MLQDLAPARTVFMHIEEPEPLTPVSYTHLRAHETVLDLVCRLLLEKKKRYQMKQNWYRETTRIEYVMMYHEIATYK